MKSISIFRLSVLIAAVISLHSCAKTNSSPSTTTTTNNPTDSNSVPAIISAGVWKVSSYAEVNEDKTKDFDSFSFTFTSDGKINATAKNESTTGTWNWGGVSYYGVSGDPTLFTINLGAVAPLNRLSRNWVIGSKSSSILVLNSSEPLEHKSVTFIKQ